MIQNRQGRFLGVPTVKLSWLIPLIGISVLSLSQTAWAGRLTYWKFNRALGRIELITDEGVQPKATFLANPSRIIVDLPNTRVPKFRQTDDTNLTKYVRGIRVGQFNPSTTRFVIELAPQYTVVADNVQIRNTAPNRWFLQLPNFLPRGSVSPQGKDAVAIDVPDSSSTLPSAPPSSSPSPSDSAPLPPDRPISSPAPIRKGATVVVIDPGHGGGDPGAVGIGGLQEKNVVFSVAYQVSQQLRQRGIRSVLTRPGDQEVDLEPRVALAERVRANIFVSIHANSISLSRTDISGLESYYYASAKGYRLARAIHNRILSKTGMQDRGIRQARFYVVRRTSMPSVLIEIGFVTGAQDARRFSSATQRTNLAEAITQGILDYLN